MTSHLPVLRHLSPASSRSRYLGLDHSHSELMRFLLWPFCLLNVQAFSFPFALNVVHSTPYSQVRHLQRMDPSSGSPSLSFPGGHLTFLPRGPGNIFPRCQGVSAVYNSVSEEPLSSSWETWVKRGQGQTEACTSCCLTQEPSV